MYKDGDRRTDFTPVLTQLLVVPHEHLLPHSSGTHVHTHVHLCMYKRKVIPFAHNFKLIIYIYHYCAFISISLILFLQHCLNGYSVVY